MEVVNIENIEIEIRQFIEVLDDRSYRVFNDITISFDPEVLDVRIIPVPFEPLAQLQKRVFAFAPTHDVDSFSEKCLSRQERGMGSPADHRSTGHFLGPGSNEFHVRIHRAHAGNCNQVG